MQLELTQQEVSTLKIALSGWSARCREEAKAMEQLAEQFPDSRDQCLRNAAASHTFETEAQAILARLYGEAI